jgi:hypothetical protein
MGRTGGEGVSADPGGVANTSFETAEEAVRAAAERGVPLRLIGGQAVRLLTPDYPPRTRNDQDMDFASVSRAKSEVLSFLGDFGFLGDRKFNTMYGHKQMYFTTADGSTSVDVIMDQLNMCHVLTFADRIERMPYTLDVADLLLSKLQVVEQNEKDVHDIVYLLSAFDVREGDEPASIGLDRIGGIVGEDWGWWRTVTMNLDRVVEHAAGDLRRLVPAAASHDPVEQARLLRGHADDVPKSLRWKLRSKVGDRVQWYQLPEEVGH